jgi:hypothetical protein
LISLSLKTKILTMKKTTIVGFAMAAILASCTQPEAPTSHAGVYSLDKVI